MDQIIGKQSMLQMICSTVSQQVRTDPNLFQNTGELIVDQVLRAQWGFSGVINENMLVGNPNVTSLYAMDDALPYPFEWASYVLDDQRGNAGMNYTFNYSMSQDYIDQDPGSYVSFLNSENIRYFYDQYNIGQYGSIIDRFDFDNEKTVDLFAAYLDDLIEHFLFQNTTSEIIGMGTMLYKEINATYGFIAQTLPLQLASRVMASDLAAAGGSCTSYVVQSGLTTEQVTKVCNDVDFTNPNSLLILINATWYGGDYLTYVYDTYGFDAQTWAAFMDTSTDTTFGYMLEMTTLPSIAKQYSCHSSTNCTALELGALQWGSSGVTKNPAPEWSSTYVPTADTLAGWGDASWAPYNDVTRNPEYFFYAVNPDTQGTLDKKTAMRIVNGNQNFYGLMNKITCQSLMNAYYNKNSTITDLFQNYYRVSMPEFDLANFILSLRKDMQWRFFTNTYIQYTASELMFGYASNSADMLSQGSYYNGDNLGLDNFTSPIFHGVDGLMAST